jgi:hypothetical protein
MQRPGCGRTDRLHLDHKLPIHQGGSRSAPSNLQWLCHSHHAQKSQHDAHPHLPDARKRLHVKGCDERGIPLDPLNPFRVALNARNKLG